MLVGRRARWSRGRFVVHAWLIALLMSTFVAPLSALAASATVVATTEVHVRECAALECDEIGMAYLGDVLEVRGPVTNGFYPVTWGDTIGYVYNLYVMTGTTAPWLIQGDVSCARVAFAFNIGIGNTPSRTILDTLVSRNVDATMFPMGSFARSQPGYLRDLEAAGFEIGTHGDVNLFLTGASDAAIRADITASRASIEAVIGRPIDPLHTPYAADTDNRVRRVVAESGLLPVGWNVAAADYATWATEQDVYTRVMNNVYPGAIIEFHLDGPATETSTARALPRIINDLRARGYSMVTVGEMAEPCNPSLPDGTTRTATVVNTGGAGLRCRTVPSVTGATITVMAEGTTVPMRGDTFGEWAPVTCAGRDGWASTAYLSIRSSTPPPPTTPTPTPAPTQPPASATTATVVNTGGAGLRCRASASLTGAIITVLAEGATVPVRGATQNGWVPITCANMSGWASAQYLSISSQPVQPTPTPTSPPTSPTPTPSPTPPPATGATARVVNTGGAGLRCRASASLSGAVITVLAEGTTVPVRGATQGGWVPITCASQAGWASADYLAISGSAPSPTPPPATSVSGVVVNTGGAGLNCRASASLGAPVITVVPEGTRLGVRGATQGGWVPVTCAGQAGWVSSSFFRVD
jgi:peptidoglycan/xylan/chitin deacetylase (PgdA/CDA1 family)/uncharacterized protein YgiM (DUF1202 family)